GELRDAGVSGRGVQLGGGMVCGETPDDRVLATTGADDEDLHAGQGTQARLCAGQLTALRHAAGRPRRDDHGYEASQSSSCSSTCAAGRSPSVGKGDDLVDVSCT